MKTVKFLALGAHKELRELKLKLAHQYSIELTAKSLADIEFYISNSKSAIMLGREDILEFDFIWLKSSWRSRHISYAVSLYLDYNEKPHTYVEYESSKLVDTLELALSNVSIPATYFCSTKKLVENYQKIKNFCKEPAIIKTTRGSLGHEVFLAKNQNQFGQICNNLNKRNHYLCQQYIPNNSDYRIITSGNEVASIYERKRTSEDFRNNAYLGAQEVSVPINSVSEKMIKIALNTVNTLDLPWSGVDVVQSNSTGEYYILEVNRRPGLTSKSAEVRAAYEHVVKLLEEEGFIS